MSSWLAVGPVSWFVCFSLFLVSAQNSRFSEDPRVDHFSEDPRVKDGQLDNRRDLASKEQSTQLGGRMLEF